MTGRALTRERGEGNTEYVILLMFVLVCAVVGLFTSYSSTIKKMQLEKGLCLDCTQRDKLAASAPNAAPTPAVPPAPAPPPAPPPSDSSKPPAPPLASSVSDLPSPPAPNSLNDWWNSFQDFLAWW